MDDTLRVDTSFASQLDQRFLLILFASIATHVIIATWVARQPAPVQVEMEQPSERWLRAPRLPIPKFPPPPVHVAPMAPRAPAPAPAPAPPGAPGAPGKPGLLGLVDGLKDLAGHDDPRDVLTNAHFGSVDTTVLATRRDGERHVETVAPIVTNGVKDVGLGEPGPTRVHLDPPTIDDPPPELPDPDKLQRFLQSHSRALLYCYEAELKRQHGLHGKLIVHFTLTSLGRARDVETRNDSLGSPPVAACVRSTVGRWVFPIQPDDDVAIEFPVLFTSTQ